MTDETANLILEFLRSIRTDVTSIRNGTDDMTLRASAAEQHLGQVQIQLGALNGRMDRFDDCLLRIERRLELVSV